MLQAASNIHGQPYSPKSDYYVSRQPSRSGWSEKTLESEDGPQGSARTLRNSQSQQTLVASEPDSSHEWRQALQKSRLTVLDGFALVLNEETGELKLVEKGRKTSARSVASSFDQSCKEDCALRTSSSGSRTPRLPPAAEPLLGSNMSTAREVLFVFTVCLAQLLSLAALAQSIAPVLVISNSLGIHDEGKMSWITAAYGSTLGTLILPAGRLGDMFGHKRIFVIGWLWFALWSLISGFSLHGGFTMLVACRAMQGIGPALLVPNGIALIGRTFPMGLKRNISIACFGGCGPVGFVIGALFSALCAERGVWPWNFFALAITCLLISLLSLLALPADNLINTSSPNSKWWERYDLPGAITGVVGLVLVNFAFNQGPIVGWQESYISFILILGLISFSIFIYIELRVSSHPLIPIKGLHREAAFTLACIACGWGSHGIWIYNFYIFAEKFRQLSALTSALQTIPVAPVGFLCAIGVVFVMRKIKVAWVMFTAMLAFLLGTLLLALAPVNQTYWLCTFFSILIMPLGMNWSFPAGTMLMSNAVPREHQGIAASLVSTMVNYSISTGLGIAGTIDRYVVEARGPEVAWRSSLWFALALDGLGVLVSGYFIWKSRAKR